MKYNLDKSDIDKLKNVPKLKNAPTYLSNQERKAYKLDVNKLVPVPVDLSKLRDIVKKYVYNARIKSIEDKPPDITNFASKTTLNGKINEVKCEIPNITNSATTSGLTAVENKIHSVRNLLKKTDYNTKINEIEKNY